MRLDKFLTECGLGSRTQVKQLLRQGRISIAGKPVSDPGLSLDPETAAVSWDGIPLQFQKFRYYLLHKPGGVVTATTDPKETTVLDQLPSSVNRKDLFPVGRLDKDTEGLLLLTNHGKLAHKLQSPKSHLWKEYWVSLRDPLTEEMMQSWCEGVLIFLPKGETWKTLPARVEKLTETTCLLQIHEGKFHQIKKMAEAVENKVVALKRTKFGPLELGDLPLGAVRELTPLEIQTLLRVVESG